MNTPNPTDHPDLTGAAAHAGAAHLIEQSLGHLYSAALRTAALHHLADHLAGGPRTAAELARLTGTDAVFLRRCLRYLASREVFREDDNGAFHLTPTAQFLRAGVPGSLRDAVLMLTDEIFVRSSSAFDETIRTGAPGFPKVFGAPFFEYLQGAPKTRELFDSGMAAFSEPIDDLVASAYPFPERGTVVDVGGGRGGLLRHILLRHPGLSGVLLDQAAAVQDHVLDTAELSGRWRAEPGDFFTSVPDGGDVYVLKHVLHDWDDASAVRILTACRHGLAPGGKVLVVDSVPAPGNAPHPGKALDVAMMTLVTGKERGPKELDDLFSRAGLRRTRILPTPTFASIVEAVAA
ncbi:methyltransferase [Streptomyces noursei]|uniref:methyltransferase n=1 Tax=Streptomyces noursei TaxID=1971 RepID=UPI001671C944|nr:methyltransferase [Streptomyces noursei]MCZ1020207.1 methyltransferase [Streptomyces noursei]GGX39695.1 O-methyltransferase [Streptomyces noursei]